ncbi:MAG: 3-dehydroquinate synthase [Selenomonadaceae bacterium]|nr:3-dehydroquinate synthase [Selenomonadaceae bacterium]
MRRIPVELGEKSYDIVIGHGLGKEIGAFLKTRNYSRRALVISDSNLAPLYGRHVLGILREAGLEAEIYVLPAGEKSKSLAEAEKIYTRMIGLGLDRKSPVFALGGGVVGDLAGFAAATYMRGVPFIQLPTSLLAQVDSSVGGKVAVNHAMGKNLIGCFYQPDAVFMELDFMESLPEREIRTGLGEIVKYGIIYDSEFFRFLEEHPAEILSLEEETLVHMIARSCEIKAAVVSEDEKESGLRRILNFGHTMAHAIEQETGYVRYNHGEAVAVGMMGAAHISRDMGLVDEAEVQRAKDLIEALHLPVGAEGCTVENMYASIFHDKKTVNGKVNWVLMESIGSVVVRNDVPEDLVKKAMAKVIDI